MLTRLITVGLALYAAATAFRRMPSRQELSPAISRRRTIRVRTVVLLASVALLLLLAGGFFFAASGVYNIAATEPHFDVVRWVLVKVRTRSVKLHSRDVNVPQSRDPAWARKGFELYRTNCEPCHGAPGVAQRQFGRGIYPNPPPLMIAAANWTDREIYWIVSHGLKLSGMPSFAVRINETDRWTLVAFLRRLQLLSPAGYAALATSAPEEPKPAAFPGPPVDYGFDGLSRGNPERGRILAQAYGCTTCHSVPGIGRASVGPPLTRFGERHFIAGSLVNLPANLVAWIVNPRHFEPDTVMPNLCVPIDDAQHIAAWLYTLGDRTRLDSLRRIVAR